MTIQEIFALTTPDDQITELKRRVTALPYPSTLKAEYELAGHKVNSLILRPDKTITESTGQTRTEYVARIALSFQKLIVERAVAFLFGNDVMLKAEGPRAEDVLAPIKSILHANKSDAFNRKLAREVFISTEAAECWYPVETKDKGLYGIDSKYKMRAVLFSPMLGDTLYPLFDDMGDLIAFSREFIKGEGDTNIKVFETYTADNTYIYTQDRHGQWSIPEVRVNPLKKIPIIYTRQGVTEWADVQILIERLEKLLSNFADTNDYHGSPTIVVKGNVVGFAKKGEQGKIVELDTDASVQYLTWDQAPESIRLEIDTLLNLIYTLTQTPNISFESVKGLNATSGIALKLMFLDAHLKVKNKEELFGEHLQRRINLLKAYLPLLISKAPASGMVDITPVITPYMIDDQESLVKMLMDATGGKAIVSQKSAVAMSGLVDDGDAEYTQIVTEEDRAAVIDIGEPTV